MVCFTENRQFCGSFVGSFVWWLVGQVAMASPMCVCDVVVGVAFLLLYFLNENSSASFFNEKTSHFDVRE